MGGAKRSLRVQAPGWLVTDTPTKKNQEEGGGRKRRGWDVKKGGATNTFDSWTAVPWKFFELNFIDSADLGETRPRHF